MKKTVVLLVVCTMVAALLAGCGGGGSSTTPAAKPTQMIMATGGTAGTYYPFGGAIAQIFNSKAPNVNVTAQATGASVENIRLLEKKEAELAIVQSDMMDYAYNGKETFKDQKLTKFAGLAILYPEIIHIIVRSDSGINSIADMKGKKVSVGAPGSGNEANVRQLLDIYGMDYKQLTPMYLSYAESADQFKDKHIDAFIMVTGAPNSALMDVSTQHSVKILSIPDDMIAKISQKYPFLSVATIPANTYKGQTEPVKTVAVQATLIVGNDVKEDVVYNITKALFDNQADLAKAHAKGKELSLEKATKGMSIPIHPGAAKYYKEKGIIK